LAGRSLRVPPEDVPTAVEELSSRARELERAAKQGGGGNGAVAVEALLTSAREVGGAQVLASAVDGVAGQELLDLADRLKARLGDAAVLLGSAGAEKVDLVASVSPALVERGVRASEIVRAAAAKVGGGSGGRDDAARGGGRDIARLPEAIDAGRAAIEAVLES
jgi:alanyl-tRNA synthetase